MKLSTDKKNEVMAWNDKNEWRSDRFELHRMTAGVLTSCNRHGPVPSTFLWTVYRLLSPSSFSIAPRFVYFSRYLPRFSLFSSSIFNLKFRLHIRFFVTFIRDVLYIFLFYFRLFYVSRDDRWNSPASSRLFIFFVLFYSSLFFSLSLATRRALAFVRCMAGKSPSLPPFLFSLSLSLSISLFFFLYFFLSLIPSSRRCALGSIHAKLGTSRLCNSLENPPIMQTREYTESAMQHSSLSGALLCVLPWIPRRRCRFTETYTSTLFFQIWILFRAYIIFLFNFTRIDIFKKSDNLWKFLWYKFWKITFFHWLFYGL